MIVKNSKVSDFGVFTLNSNMDSDIYLDNDYEGMSYMVEK